MELEKRAHIDGCASQIATTSDTSIEVELASVVPTRELEVFSAVVSVLVVLLVGSDKEDARVLVVFIVPVLTSTRSVDLVDGCVVA